ncbi:hypothetical protein M422DRAFT_165853 [Sphaerobolus stellatus SS14]|uniref:CENP-V/GFA domain-containing protein n=1 Tax=Sphaerobolus stellatus (strain SS14) TaxID=990650 RepID=A0A0C9VTP6_SPHS4|nr:hypothetical protein M422DRAFT_165853 [Sphaerobolus stellatus SS14]
MSRHSSSVNRGSDGTVRVRSTSKVLYNGCCHCGRFEFEFMHPSLEDGFEVIKCNCSICIQRGYLMVYITNVDKDFRLMRGTYDELSNYRFNKGVVSHYFCPDCGTGMFGEASSDSGGRMLGVNVRCVPSLDLDRLRYKKVDGRSM